MKAENKEPVDRTAEEAALRAWTERGHASRMERWLGRILDPEGVPRRLPVCEWGELLGRLDEARRRRGADWPETIEGRIEGLLRATLRFSRTDGSAAFAPPGARPDLLASFRAWAERLSDPGLGTVVDWWSRRRSPADTYAAPPLPAWSSPQRPLAMLRANWSRQGDSLAIDHRTRGVESQVELTGLGRTWLGPSWVTELGRDPATVGAPRPTYWVSNPSADLAEWSFRQGGTRVTRTALLLRGRRIALLADQLTGEPGRAGVRIALPEGVEAVPLSEGNSRAIGLHRGRASARVVPIGLTRADGLSHRGSLAAEGRQLCLGEDHEGRRCWLPLLVSWDPLRDRKGISWRVLSVAEKSRNCRAETAFAARVSWGRGETLLIYRSLARPALRSFLGHQTRARFLVALFTREGEVVPILKVD